ncbi:MAG: 4-(cytidine 5'-diphospho)-2-C-methyl-D-erythritol kinase [Treponema sp.]|jgi:4-diphosphocytidyl-2-C-methyl-D-erythritol kinase|nr:4-(cytidine 5'-diphospho)-2-C-methyl-D-erythritol kinase [Treponema sp.]
MLKNVQNLIITAPAKVNLHLAVLERRPDGFHNLESVFLALDFADTLFFEPFDQENALEIDMKTGSVPIPAEKNIIFRTISLFRAKTGFFQGLRVKVEKRIPIGGGLGGGSSNAASTLLALNKLASSPLNRDSLLEMGASLGSDIPFFLREIPAAKVTGRGECIEPIDIPRLFLVLVNPGFHSDTAAAYRLLDKKREGEKIASSKAPENGIAFNSFWNDFLPVFEEPEKSVYNDIIAQLEEIGAEYANLSGSGSTCFGVFYDRAKAEKAAVVLRDKWSFSEFCCSYKKLSM